MDIRKVADEFAANAGAAVLADTGVELTPEELDMLAATFLSGAMEVARELSVTMAGAMRAGQANPQRLVAYCHQVADIAGGVIDGYQRFMSAKGDGAKDVH